MKTLITFSFFILLGVYGFGQKPAGRFIDPREASEHFDHENYSMALKVYKELLKRDPDDIEYNYKAAICYLKTSIDKKQAIPYLEKITKRGKGNYDIWFNLGKAYQYANRFKEAIDAYTKAKDKGSKKEVEDADHAIETCYNGIEFTKHPVNVTFENLGKDINTEYADYYPFSTKNESFMVFTSRRKGGKGASLEMDGLYPSDIYMSTVKEGKWVKASNIGSPVNTGFDEQAVGLAPDGSSMIVYIDHLDSMGNIYSSKFSNGKFQKLVKLNANVNSDFETSGSMSEDGNIIFFASKRGNGLGGTDIYMSKKLPNGQWALAQNLGKTINTPYDEDFPHMAEDGKTLYFASQGHSSMGGFDVFKSIYDEETNTWSEPQNLGYPINTSDDNMTISFTSNNRCAYVSALRDGGFGDLDIYRIRFNEEEPLISVFHGYVRSSDSLQTGNIEVQITATNLSTPNETPQVFTPIISSGKYVMSLTPGVYSISIEGAGFAPYQEELHVLEKGSFQPEIQKDFKLSKAP